MRYSAPSLPKPSERPTTPVTRSQSPGSSGSAAFPGSTRPSAQSARPVGSSISRRSSAGPRPSAEPHRRHDLSHLQSATRLVQPAFKVPPVWSEEGRGKAWVPPFCSEWGWLTGSEGSHGPQCRADLEKRLDYHCEILYYCRLLPVPEPQQMPGTRAEGRWRRGGSIGVICRAGRSLCPGPEDDGGWCKCFAGRESDAGRGRSHWGAIPRHPQPIIRGLRGNGPWRGDMPLSPQRLSAAKGAITAPSPVLRLTWPGPGFQDLG